MNKCKCSYCSRHGFPAMWRIKNNLLWYEIPKNGSWTIKQSYHIKKHNKPPALSDKILVIFRDPQDRFKSLFMHYFLEEGIRFPLTKEFYQKKRIDITSYNIEDRKSIFFDTFDQLDTDMEVHHFYPQMHFVPLDYKIHFKVIDIKNLSLEMKVPVKNNTSRKRENLISFTEKEKIFIRNFYNEDFEFMKGYKL